MIWTVFEVSLRRLLNNRIELVMTFVVPIAFFSVFAVIFGGGIGSGSTPKIKTIVLDQVDSTFSREVVSQLRQSAGLRLMRQRTSAVMSADDAGQLVRRGSVTLAIVIRNDDESLAVDLLSDASDQVASQVATALVSQSLMIAQAERPQDAIGGSAEASEPQSPSEFLNRYSAKPESTPASAAVAAAVAVAGESVRVVDVMGAGKANPVVSMYAAGIAVMFLLFGAAGGGGALLEERESQTLDRLLSTRLSMDQLLLGKWFYMTALGVLQVSVMFLWGQLIFGVDLLGHLDGFIIMTVVTASAAAAFGLFLATLCRSRGQLNGLSVILILTMSALGGSMVPRYVMSERLQEFGLWTFNAWALDGYDKVFWRELPVNALSPQLVVLLACGVFFLVTARALAVRWETD